MKEPPRSTRCFYIRHGDELYYFRDMTRVETNVGNRKNSRASIGDGLRNIAGHLRPVVETIVFGFRVWR
jgi:hypothetical protein